MAVSVNPYLRQARSCLITHASEGAPPEDAWSAAYLPLTQLLGDPLTKALRKTGELKQDYRYIGTDFALGAEKSVNEHVVPLRCIVEALIANPHHWSGKEGVATLKAFMVEHLVMAFIPKSLEKKLSTKSTMPDPKWSQPIGPGFSAEQKQKALWSRYALMTPKLVLPYEPYEEGKHDFKQATGTSK